MVLRWRYLLLKVDSGWKALSCPPPGIAINRLYRSACLGRLIDDVQCLNWKLVLKHVCLLFHALFSFPNLKTSFEAYICCILCFAFFLYSTTSFEACISLIPCSLAWKLVLKHVYLLSQALFSFPNLKTSFEAYIYYILCFFTFPYSTTSFEACISLIPCFLFPSLTWKLVLKHVYLLF